MHLFHAEVRPSLLVAKSVVAQQELSTMAFLISTVALQGALVGCLRRC